MIGWNSFLQGKLLPDWGDIINNELIDLISPPNLWAVPQLMKALITTTLNLWRTRCDFIHGGSTSETINKKLRILLQQMEDLKTRKGNLGRKG